MANFAKTPEQIEELREQRMACIGDIRRRYDEVRSAERDRGDGQANPDRFNWKEIMDRHPKVPRRYFFTLVAKVKQGSPDEQILQESIKSLKVMALSELVPVAPSPNVIARGGGMRTTIDFMSHIDEMLSDINMIRDWSLSEPDDQGQQKIKNPHYFMLAIRLRREVLDTTLKGYQEFWDLRKMTDFYDAIVEEVGREAPEVAGRILERLNALNNERGLTLSAQV